MPLEMLVDDNNNQLFDQTNDQQWMLDKSISVLALDPADRRVLQVADQRDAVQKKTFTKWMNFYLTKRNGLSVDDLYWDLRDGHLLLSLLEIFTNRTMPRERGSSKFHALRNIEQCLQSLEQDHHIRLVNIRPEELLNGNPKLTLGLIWRIILHFQFSDINLPAFDEHIPITESTSTKIKISVDQIPPSYRSMLLIWSRQQCQGYPGISIDDFTRSWRDGRAFLAILHRHNPQLIDMKQVYRRSNRENLTQAFHFAQKHYGIAQLIDPEDIDIDEPDEKSILLYIAHLYKACPTLPIHPLHHQHDRIRLEIELTYEYTHLAADILKWIKTKIDLFSGPFKFQTFGEFQTILHAIKDEEFSKYDQLLQRMRTIDAEFETLELDESLQPDIESMNLAWNRLQLTIDQVDNELKHYEKLKLDLDSIEHHLSNTEKEAKQSYNRSTIHSLNEIQLKLDQISKHCHTFSLPHDLIQTFLNRINQLHLRINIQLSSSSPITNGFQSKRQTHSPQSVGIEQLKITFTDTFEQSLHSSSRPYLEPVQSNIQDLIEELQLIDLNLNALEQLLQQRIIHLHQTGLPTSNDDLVVLFQQHKDFENNLLSQASRVKDIRNHVREEYKSSSHQELRSVVNQTSDHVQNLFGTSKIYSDKLDIADVTLNLVNSLTTQLDALDARLASQSLFIDEENSLHQQLNELNEFYHQLQTLEKSIKELLVQSKQLDNERLIRISEQFLSKSKQMTSEIHSRKRSITQIIESHRSFQALFNQEDHVLNNLQRRFQTLEPILPDREKLLRMTKTVTDLFNEIISRAQPIEHMNDVAVKLIEEVKMHDKNLKHFRNINPNLQASISTQHSSQAILDKVESFDRRYANLLANMEEYTRLFLKNSHTTGLMVNLPIDSASAIVHLYRSTLASRYNMTFESLLSSNEGEESSAKWNKNQTGFIDLSHGKVTVDRHYPSSSLDGSISLETTYVIPASEISPTSNKLDNDPSTKKKVTFLIQKQTQPFSIPNGNTITVNSASTKMTQRKSLSFVDAVNSKYLDLSTGLFSSSIPFVLSSSSSSSSSSPFSSSISPPDQHRHPHNHFSPSSSSPPHTTTNITTTTTTTTNNKNLLSTSPLSVNNHPPSLVGPDSATTTTTITLKEAIETNILDARSAYVVDTLEQRNYDLREAYSRGLINATNHHILDRATARQYDLGEALKMGILKVGDPQSYNVTSKTESLIISSVFDHRLNSFIEPNTAIRTKILDPYHGLYLNNLTQESFSIDDAMAKGFLTVEQQPQQSAHNHDKYVISTSLIRETRSYHLLGVRDYVNNKELSVQEAIRIGILDKKNGQYINRKTNEIFSISEAIAHGHIRAQPLPVEAADGQEILGNTTNKRGTVKETKTYTLKSAIHPRTRQEIPIRLAIDEGIIDHAKGFYVNSVTGENLPISVAIEKGLIFTELIDPHARRFVKTLIIEQVVDPVTGRRLGVTEAIKTGLLNSSVTVYYHSVSQKQLTILEAFEQGFILGQVRDQHPSSFYGDQREQVFYLITGVIDIRTDKVYNLQEGIQQRLFDHKKGVYLHPITNDEINIGEAVKRGFIQVQAVSSQIVFNNTDQTSADKRRAIISQQAYGNDNDSRSKLSIRIESQGRSRAPYEINESETLQRDKDVVEIESIQRLPRHRKQQYTTREEEIIEQHTTNIVDREVFLNRNGINRPKSTERQRQQYIEEVIIDDGINPNRRAKFDIKEDRHTSHREIVIEGDRIVPPPPKDHLVINGTHREHEVRVVPATRPLIPVPPPRPVHIDDRQREGQRIHHGELIIDDHQRPSTSSTSARTTITKEYIDITDHRSKPSPPISTHPPTNEYSFDEHQSWTEEEWEQWHCILMIKDQPYRVVWVLNTATGDRLPLQTAYQRGLVDTKQRLFYDEKLNRQSYSFEKAVELGYMGIEPDTASLPLHVDGIDYMIHWVLDSSTKHRIFPRPAVRKQILDAIHGRYVNPYNNSQVSLHEAIHLKFIGATEYNSTADSITIIVNGQNYTIKWVYDTRNMKKILPRDALRQGILDIQLNEYRKFDTNDVLTIYDAIQAGYIRCNDDDSSSDNSIRPPSIISVDEDELTIATKTATYVITSVIHPLTQKEIKVSEAIDLGILDKDIGTYRDLVTNVQYELAEAINEGLVYATIIETKEDTEMLTSSVQEIVKKFIIRSVAVDSESQEKIGGLEAQAIGILNYAQGVYHDRKHGVKIPLDKAIEKKLLDVELISQNRFEEYDLESITDTITERRITLYKIHGVRNNVLDRMESGAVAVKNQVIDTEAKTYTDFSKGETMTIQEAINRKLIDAEISEHVERKPLGLSLQNAIRLGFYVAETGTFRDPTTEHYMTLLEAIERGHIHVNGIAFADSEQGPITLYDAFSLGLINRRDGGKLNPAKISVYRARLVESKLHRMNVEDAIRCGLLNLRTGLYKHPHSGEQLNLKEAIQRGLIDGQSTIIEHPTSGRFLTLKEALDGIRIDHEGQVIDLHSNKTITTLELAFNHRKLFSQFDVNASEVFLPNQNESVGFEKAIRKNLLDNNRMKLFDPKTSREYTIQDAMERGLVDSESGLIYDTHSHTQYSVREAIRHGIVAIVGAPLVPIKADHETVAAKITSRNYRRHSVAKSSLHFDYNSAPESADEDSHGSGGGWHRIKSKTRAISPLSVDGASDFKRQIRRRTGSGPSQTCRDDNWRRGWRGGSNDDDDAFGSAGGGSGGTGRTGGSSFYSSTTTTTTHTEQNQNSTNPSQGGKTSAAFEQKQEQILSLPTVAAEEFELVKTSKSNERSPSPSKLKNDENRLMHEMHAVVNRLTVLHHRLDRYVYLTEDRNELRENIERIQELRIGIEKERSIIENLSEQASKINPQLLILSTELEDKRVEISDINRSVSDIIRRFLTNVDQFHLKNVYLTEWLEIHERKIGKSVQLSTLDSDLSHLKDILNTAIHLQTDLQSLRECFQKIDGIVKDFDQITDSIDGRKLIDIFQQRLDLITGKYSDFLQRCRQISGECDRHLILFNEVTHLNDQFFRAVDQFNRSLVVNEKRSTNDSLLQSLLLNVQTQLDRLGLLATHEPTSPSGFPLANDHIRNEIKEHLDNLLESQTKCANDAQTRLMHHFDLIERFRRERQTIKERLSELSHWFSSALESDLLSRPISLKRSKLDEQIVDFRQFHAHLRTRRHSFHTNINIPINREQLFDRDDQDSLELIEGHLQLLETRTNQYNEQINRLSTRLNEFHLEHGHLIEIYSKSLRLFTEQIQRNDDWSFSTLQFLLNQQSESIVDPTFYEQLVQDLRETENVEDVDEIDACEQQMKEYRTQYEKFQKDLKIILQNRAILLNEYQSIHQSIEQWLISTDRLLKQQLTIETCRQLLLEHSQLPIEQLQTYTDQLNQFYSSTNLLSLYEHFKVSKSTDRNSTFQIQTNELIEIYSSIKGKLLHYIEALENIEKYQENKRTTERTLEQAKALVTSEENTILPLDSHQVELLHQKYKGLSEQLKSMSSIIDEYKTSGLTLINTAPKYIELDTIQNDLATIEKSWSEYVEYILDTLDYIQLHQEDLNEFYQLSTQLLDVLNEREIFTDVEWKNLSEQVNLVDQKGELLLQSSATDSNENEIERLLDTIHRKYDSLRTRSNHSSHHDVPSQTVNPLLVELRHHVDELDVAMNELSELLVSSTQDPISAQSIKLTEQLMDNAVVQNELEKRKLTLDQIQILRQNFEDKVFDERILAFNNHWLIMKHASELREENLLLTQLSANRFWSEYHDLRNFLVDISQQLLQVQEDKCDQLVNDLSMQRTTLDEILWELSPQLLTLIADNEQESKDIRRSVDDLEQEWTRVQTNLITHREKLSQMKNKTSEFQIKLEHASTWFDEKAPATTMEKEHDLEHIRTFKEHLDMKYIDVLSLKQDYTDVEQERVPLVQEQLVEIDSKWAQLNERIQEHKTLIYETALRQHRVGDVLADITHSLDTCASKLSLLDDDVHEIKQMEILLAKLRILLHEIDLISYDIEQFKQSNEEGEIKVSIAVIDRRWKELLRQTNARHRLLENRLEQMKNKQIFYERIQHELKSIDQQINESMSHSKLALLIERLEEIEREIVDENDQLKNILIDVKQRATNKNDELVDLSNSIEHFHNSLQQFTGCLSECERYLNTRKPIQYRFGLFPLLLKQIDEHKAFEEQLEIYREEFARLDKRAVHLIYISSKVDSMHIRNLFKSIQLRWQKILNRTSERTRALDKAFQEGKKNLRPVVADLDRIKNEIHRQASLCQCSKKYDVQQIAEGRYRFGESQSLRLVRILRSTVMVRVGGGWTALDEFLVRHDPCRAKGRTNYELHPEIYALRDGVAQTMTLFKPRLVTAHQPTCLYHQQQCNGSVKQSLIPAPIRLLKDKSQRTSSTVSLIPPLNSSSIGDSSVSGDDLSLSSTHLLSDSETKPSQIPIPSVFYTPATSILSRTSSRESILSEHSSVSTQRQRPSKLPLPISRQKKTTTDGTTSVKNS